MAQRSNHHPPLERRRKRLPELMSVAVAKKTTIKDIEQDRKIRKLQSRVGKTEVKYSDSTPSSPIALSNTGAIAALNYNSQGLQPFSRVGNQFKNIFIRIHGYILVPGTETVDRLVRLQLIWDADPHGTLTSIYGSSSGGAIVINDNTNTNGLLPNIFAPHAIELKDRFKVIYDKIIHVQLQSTDVEAAMPFKIHKKLKRITRFNNTTGVIGSLQTNGLLFTQTIDNAGAGIPLINYTARLYYTDD